MQWCVQNLDFSDFYLSDENISSWPRDLDLEVKVTIIHTDLAATKVHRLTKFGEDPSSGFLGFVILTNKQTNKQTDRQTDESLCAAQELLVKNCHQII